MSERRPERIRTPHEACEEAFLRAYCLEQQRPGYIKVDELTHSEYIRMHSTISPHDLFISRPTVDAETDRQKVKGARALEDSYDFTVLKVAQNPAVIDSKQLYVINNIFFPFEDNNLMPKMSEQESSMLVAEIASGHLIEVERPMTRENRRWRGLLRSLSG